MHSFSGFVPVLLGGIIPSPFCFVSELRWSLLCVSVYLRHWVLMCNAVSAGRRCGIVKRNPKSPLSGGKKNRVSLRFYLPFPSSFFLSLYVSFSFFLSPPLCRAPLAIQHRKALRNWKRQSRKGIEKLNCEGSGGWKGLRAQGDGVRCWGFWAQTRQRGLTVWHTEMGGFRDGSRKWKTNKKKIQWTDMKQERELELR